MCVRIFVYGTLKPDELEKPTANEYQRSCLSQLLKAQPATAFGHLYDLPFGYPAMTLGDHQIHGFLLTFENENILDLLDEYEGYNPNSNDNEYDRQQIEVFNSNQVSLGFAWAYFMTHEQVDRCGGVLIPNGIWMRKQK